MIPPICFCYARIRMKCAPGPKWCQRAQPLTVAFAHERPHDHSRTDAGGMSMLKPEANKTRPRDAKAIEAAIAALTQKFGNRLVTSQAVREQHGNTLTWIANQPP